MPARKTEKPIFDGITVAVAGDLGQGWTETHVTQWVKLRKGNFAQEIDESVTHLVCSLDEYKKKTRKVREALKLGKKVCHVVSKHWLEDSITKKRRLKEHQYLHDVVLRKALRKAKAKKAAAKEVQNAERFVNAGLYHIYRDSTYFAYKITLTRDDAEAGIEGERYLLHLYESNAKPSLYYFAAKHYRKKGDSHSQVFRPSSTPRLLDIELTHFEDFFYKKTGVKWDKRLVTTAPPGGRYFTYRPPTGGKPVGEIKDMKNIPKVAELNEVVVTSGGDAAVPAGGPGAVGQQAEAMDGVAQDLMTGHRDEALLAMDEVDLTPIVDFLREANLGNYAA